jgi:uncharacterized protein (TIGR03086 family)
VLAEQAGWDGVFVWEAAYGVDAWSVLAAAAVRTARVRLGTMLTPLPWRRPWKVAMRHRLAAGPLLWKADHMTDPVVLTDFDHALAATEAVVAGIGPGQWQAPTPCTELDVRAVVNHLVSGNLMFAALVRSEPLPERGADQLGDDPPGSFQRAGRELREAFTAPGVLETVFTAPFGTAPGSALVHVRIVELLTHGWDLARATGQKADFPDDLAERTLAATRHQLAARPEGPGAPFAAEVTVPDDAAAIDRLAGFLGRPI